MEMTPKKKAIYLVTIFGKEYAYNFVNGFIMELIEIQKLISDEVELPFKYWYNVKIQISLL